MRVIMMQIEEAVIDALRVLPNEEKIKVLDYTKSLRREKSMRSRNGKRKSVIGSLSHLNIEFSEEDLREARREMWPDYREDSDK
jgi:hypothetical protein